jgi:all-trans-retinol 13,14-reductase
MDKHVIIIGSGLGGLTCGYILAKNGYRVTVLEKNAQLGGCLQTFTRQGVKYETGMHYIGSMKEGQTLHSFFKYLSLLPGIKLRPLDKMAYDVISIAGERFPFANGEENFIELLACYFPQERKNLQAYFRVIKEVAGSSPLYSLQCTDAMTLLNPDHVKQSASGFIESVIPDNPLLQKVLAGNIPLYAGVKGKTPLYIHALVNDFYNESTYRIIGGSDSIAKSLVKSIRSMGGTVRALAGVTKINCNYTEAVSVTLKSGEELKGDYFISNIHPVRMIELLDTHLIRKSFCERISRLDNTIGNFTVYIQFKKNTLPYYNSNLYHYNGQDDVWRGSNYTPNAWPNSFLYMHLCSSFDQQFADGAILMAYMNYGEVAKWKGTKIGNRGDEYDAFKQLKSQQLIDLLEQQNPGTRANIERYYSSTPLTYLDYTGTEQGSMYGILRDCNELVQTAVSQRTKIPNLFQTGQNINSHGILGVIIGSIITSGELLGVNTIIKQIREA